MTTVYAGPKVTLALHVVGTRPDGYHLLDALVVHLDAPVDELRFVAGERGCRVTPEGAAPTDATNLAVRALEALGVTVGLELHKRIPSQAGLGGGSADAAAVLRAFGADRSADDLAAIAMDLGADVAACLLGGVHRMGGIGEILEPVRVDTPLHLVVVTPVFGCSTPAVYRRWDELGGPRSQHVVAPPPGWDHLDIELRNDLDAAAHDVAPGLQPMRRDLEALTGRPTLLCGSGSSLALFADDEVHAGALVHEILADERRADTPRYRLVTAATNAHPEQ